MNYASMIEEKRLKQGFIIATLISTIVGTFTTGINLFDRLADKRRQHKTDHGQDQKIRELERRVNEATNSRSQSRSGAGRDSSRSRSRRGGRGRGDDDDGNDLRGSLAYGGPMVRREYDRGYADMGSRFAEGDLIAQTQLQSQIITLQGTVIKLLEEALLTGQPPDVRVLLNASEFAREGSVKALRDQYQRLLQSAPVQRPMGLVRRISSTPTLRDSGSAASSSATSTSDRTRGTDRHPVPPQKAIAFNKPGPLFCAYAEELQRNAGRQLDRAFLGRGSGGGCGPCPACGAVIATEGEGRRRSWNIVKEVVRERVSRGRGLLRAADGGGREGGGRGGGAEVVEIVQDRTYLLTDRFIVKCHREGAGFACYLCFRHRDRDALCKAVQSLVTHVLEKHDVGEYETDPDIRDVTSAYR